MPTAFRQLSSYLVLSAIAHTCPLAPKALSAVLKAIAASARRVSTKQTVRTLASVCAGQDAEVLRERPLSKIVVKTLLQLSCVQSFSFVCRYSSWSYSGLVEEVQESLAYVGSERFVGAFGQAIITRYVHPESGAGKCADNIFFIRLEETHAFDVLTSLLTLPKLPRALVQDLAGELIRLHITSLESHEAVSARARSLLVHLQQRQPAALQTAFETVLNDSGEAREAVEQLLLSLSVALPEASSVENLDSVLASTTADSSVRAIAVRQLYEKLESSMELPESERVRDAQPWNARC